MIGLIIKALPLPGCHNSMSNKYTEQWLEDAKQAFEEAVAGQQWEFAQAIIQDLRDHGFGPNAVALEESLAAKRDA